MCGGTQGFHRCLLQGRGLSPRVRGNLCYLCRLPIPERSIPACAGEPLQPICHDCYGQVYPRVCGGTDFGLCGAPHP